MFINKLIPGFFILASLLYCCNSDIESDNIDVLNFSNDDFKIIANVTMPDSTILVTEVYFINKMAYEVFDDSLSVVYDLEGMTFYDFNNLIYLNLERCEEWLKGSVDKANQSIANSNDQKLNKFVKAIINPDFKIQESGPEIKVFNDYFVYSIEGEQILSEEQNSIINSYNILQAYQKAITEKKLPPNSQLEFSKILNKKSILPRKLALIATFNDVSATIIVEYMLTITAQNEIDFIRKFIKSYKGNLPKQFKKM